MASRSRSTRGRLPRKKVIAGMFPLNLEIPPGRVPGLLEQQVHGRAGLTPPASLVLVGRPAGVGVMVKRIIHANGMMSRKIIHIGVIFLE